MDELTLMNIIADLEWLLAKYKERLAKVRSQRQQQAELGAHNE